MGNTRKGGGVKNENMWVILGAGGEGGTSIRCSLHGSSQGPLYIYIPVYN